MNALGRGLASLIPKREKGAAEDIIEQIDSMEIVAEEPENVRALNRQTKQAQDSADSKVKSAAKTIAVTEDEADDSASDIEEQSIKTKRQVDVIEEFEDLENEDGLPIPSAPAVTPLEIDPDTGQLLRDPSSEKVTDDEATKATIEVMSKKAVDTTISALKNSREKNKPDAQKQVEKSEPSKRKSKSKHDNLDEIKEPGVITTKTFALINDERVLGQEVQYVPIGEIEVNPFQPRRSFNVEELEELKNSLEQHGMLQPMIVMEKEDKNGYQIIAGERRWRAAKDLKWDDVPCVVREQVAGDRNKLELALTENVQRQNLNPIEEAMGYKTLAEEYGMTHEDIAIRVGKSRAGVTNIMRLLQLPAEVQRGLIDEKITLGHAKAILMVPDEEKQQRFYKHVVDEGLTVRKAENRARNIQRAMKIDDPMRKKRRGRPQLALDYEGKLQGRFGHNARIKFNLAKNRFEVIFYGYSEDEAREIVGRLMGTLDLPQNVDADVLED